MWRIFLWLEDIIGRECVGALITVMLLAGFVAWAWQAYRKEQTGNVRETLYKERGAVCEACGRKLGWGDDCFTVFPWILTDWYEKGLYSILCQECHYILATRWNLGMRLPPERPTGLSYEDIDRLAHERRECIQALVDKWVPIMRKEVLTSQPKEED